MDSPVIETVDSPIIKKEGEGIETEIETEIYEEDSEFELILDITTHNVVQLEDVFQVVRNVVYNEIEYLLICDRLNEIYKEKNYETGEIPMIFKLTEQIYNRMVSIYTNNSKMTKFYNKEHRKYILTLEHQLYDKLSELRSNYEDVRSIIEVKNDCIVNDVKKESQKPKIMKKAARRNK